MTFMKILTVFFVFVSACAFSQPIKSGGTPAANKIDLVNPFIGTGGHGHTFPGATFPYGMVQLSPDTRLNGWDACSGYHQSDQAILGFTHTHLSGTGIGDYGDILFMPITGQPQLTQGTAEDPDAGYCSKKVAETESASPGYYTVTLADYDVNVELTSTARAGMHRYTFPKSKAAGVIIDIGHTLQSHHNQINQIEILNDHEIRGYKLTKGWAREQHVYFHAVFSKPFTTRFAVNDEFVKGNAQRIDQVGAKAVLDFQNLDGKELIVKVGISAVDFDGARKNVYQEIPAWDFNGVRSAASLAWKKWLDKIDIKGGSADQQKIFYTALYHTAISPNLFTDVDGRYRGMDKKIHQANGSENYTVFSLWDTFRAFHPLIDDNHQSIQK
jgi:predicted alpha-1,2-mannosidase